MPRPTTAVLRRYLPALTGTLLVAAVVAVWASLAAPPARPAWATAAAAAVLLGTAAVVLAATARRLALVAAAGLAAALGWAGPWGLARLGLQVDPDLVRLSVVAGSLATAAMRFGCTGREALRLRAAFRHTLAPHLVERLVRASGSMPLGGEQREMSFVFTDLEGFTALMGTVEPAAAVALLSGYFDGLCDIAIGHGGTIDTIVGDAVLVMFNAPLDQPDHASRAVHCAMAMDAFAQNYAIARRAEGLAFGATRIGVNTGPAVVGNFGGQRRFDYTAHGEAITVAAQLEGANKVLGTRLCIAAATAAQVEGLDFLPVGTLVPHSGGRGIAVVVPASEGATWLEAYRTAYRRIEAGDETAGLAILALHQQEPDHPVLALHAKRVRSGERTLRLAA